jgi:hypothetical protein
MLDVMKNGEWVLVWLLNEVVEEDCGKNSYVGRFQKLSFEHFECLAERLRHKCVLLTR